MTKILAIRLSALGDICMTLPVLDSFCRTYPDVELTLLTSKIGAKVANTVIHLPNFKCLAINKNDYNGLSGMNKLYNELREQHFDVVADLHDVLRTKWVRIRFKLAGKKVSVIDKGRKDKKSLTAHQDFKQLTSGIERYRAVFAELGYPFEVDYDGRKVGQLLAGADRDVSPTSIGIAPFAQHQGKIYPIAQMRQAIRLMLQKRSDLHIYLFGSKEEAAELESWRQDNPERIHNLAGAQFIDADLRTMSCLRAMVSMDSANMHLASLVGTRCFSIWGATHQYAGFLGYGQQPSDCIELPLPCRPCSIYGNKPCKFGDYRCMSGLTPETVADKILTALN